MALYLANIVLHGLKGFTETSRRKRPDGKGVTSEEHHVLLCYAHLQDDPGWKGEANTVCDVRTTEMLEITQLPETTFKAVRKSLVKKKLLVQHDKATLSHAKNGSTRAGDAYSVCVNQIREMRNDLSDEDWKRKVLHLPKEHEKKKTSADLRAMGLNTTVQKPVQKDFTEPEVVKEAESLSNSAAKEYRNSLSPGACESVKQKPETESVPNVTKSDELAALYGSATLACGADSGQIIVSTFKKVVNAIGLERAKRVINNKRQEFVNSKKSSIAKIRILIAALKSENENPCVMKQTPFGEGFGKQEKVKSDEKDMNEKWQRIVTELKLHDLPKDDLNAMKQYFRSTYLSCNFDDDKRKSYFETLIGNSKSDLAATPNANLEVRVGIFVDSLRNTARMDDRSSIEASFSKYLPAQKTDDKGSGKNSTRDAQ